VGGANFIVVDVLNVIFIGFEQATPDKYGTILLAF
jgi:hypothetical protein